MKPINEKTFQESLISFFGNLGYSHKTDDDLFEENLRQTKKDFLLRPILLESLKNINVRKTDDQINQAIFEIEKINNRDLILGNKKFNEFLQKGIDTFNKKTDSYEKIFLFDRNDPNNNNFLVVDEFKFSGSEKNKRCDIVVFLNGIPISIIELKNPHDETVDIKSAFNQMQNYQRNIQDLFLTNCFNVISDYHNSGVGTITSPFERFIEFKDEIGEKSYENHFGGLFAKKNLIDIISNFLIFTSENKKIICAYHQFFCVNKIIKKSLLSVKERDSQVGVVWHTTGSGKSLTMTFYTKKLIDLFNPLIILLTDRIDLDNQLYETFDKASDYLNSHPKKVNSREDLIQTLDNRQSGGIVFTTIQKFQKEKDKLRFDKLSERDDIFIIADEAHRSQYGTEKGNAKHIRDALPNAKLIGFSGTPIELENRNTKLIFGDYIDKYVMNRAVADKTTVKIFYESRLAKIGLKKEMFLKFDKRVDELFAEAGEEREGRKDFLKMESIIRNEERLRLIAKDFADHFKLRQTNVKEKAMFVCFSRKAAVDFFEILKGEYPGWFNADDKKGKVKLIMSGSSSDDKRFEQHVRSREKLREIEKRFKDEKDELEIVLVIDMWLTGFDVPCLCTLYVDRPLKEHGLIQAISRVNRVYKDKGSGLVVDYIGIGDYLKRAVNNFSNEDKEQVEYDFEKIIQKMIEKYELTKSYFKDYDYSEFLTSENYEKKLEIVRGGIDLISENKDIKKRFLLNCFELTKAYSLCPLSDEAKEIVEEIVYFKAVRAGIKKFNKTSDNIVKEVDLDHELNKIVSQSIEAKGIIDIYELSGVKNPEISILSEEFFAEIRNAKYKNIAYELLKKVLTDEIKEITRGNIVLEKKFSEKLSELVMAYENKTIESAKVIEEMINLAKTVKDQVNEEEKLNLNEDEIKFYHAVAEVNGVEEVMGQDILKELAKELVFEIRRSRTVDWNLKKQTRAKMRILIKNLLKKYNYPPNDEEEARNLVLEQAKVFCEDTEIDSNQATHKFISINSVIDKRILDISIPVLAEVSAGVPINTAEENLLGYMVPKRGMIKNQNDFFSVKVDGNSMNLKEINGKKIEYGNYVLVEKTDTAENGDTILAIVNGHASIKEFHKEENMVILRSVSTEDIPDIIINDSDEFMINGHIVDVIEE